tara:strand:+ start:34766 stop:35017 length:252 start_codon:yes stop_codon:yes gene_type:complete
MVENKAEANQGGFVESNNITQKFIREYEERAEKYMQRKESLESYRGELAREHFPRVKKNERIILAMKAAGVMAVVLFVYVKFF